MRIIHYSFCKMKNCKMKSFFGLLLCAVLCLVFVSCSGNEKQVSCNDAGEHDGMVVYSYRNHEWQPVYLTDSLERITYRTNVSGSLELIRLSVKREDVSEFNTALNKEVGKKLKIVIKGTNLYKGKLLSKVDGTINFFPEETKSVSAYKEIFDGVALEQIKSKNSAVKSNVKSKSAKEAKEKMLSVFEE